MIPSRARGMRRGSLSHTVGVAGGGLETRAVDLEHETLVFERDGSVDYTAQPVGTTSRAPGVAVDLDEDALRDVDWFTSTFDVLEDGLIDPAGDV